MDILNQNGVENTTLDYKRIETARFNRRIQLENWMEYDKKMNNKKHFRKFYKNKVNELVKFSGQCILLETTLRGDIDEVKNLLCQGIDPNLANIDGLTPLHQACIDNDLPLCQLLITYGANVNARDADNWTPLHAAATCGYLQICQLLIKNNADLKAINTDGMLPFDICEDQCTFHFLQDHMREQGITQEDVDRARSLPETHMLADLKQFKTLGRSLNTLDAQGAAPIHVSAACGYADVAQFLLQSGVNPNCLDADGWTACHVAACWGEIELIRLFVSYGANLNIPTPDGKTVFSICETPESQEEVCSIWNMRELLIAEMKSKESTRSDKSLRRRRSTSSIHRTSMREKSNITRRDVQDEAQNLSKLSMNDERKEAVGNHKLNSRKDDKVKRGSHHPLMKEIDEAVSSMHNHYFLNDQNSDDEDKPSEIDKVKQLDGDKPNPTNYVKTSTKSSENGEVRTIQIVYATQDKINDNQSVEVAKKQPVDDVINQKQPNHKQPMEFPISNSDKIKSINALTLPELEETPDDSIPRASLNVSKYTMNSQSKCCRKCTIM